MSHRHRKDFTDKYIPRLRLSAPRLSRKKRAINRRQALKLAKNLQKLESQEEVNNNAPTPRIYTNNILVTDGIGIAVMHGMNKINDIYEMHDVNGINDMHKVHGVNQVHEVHKMHEVHEMNEIKKINELHNDSSENINSNDIVHIDSSQERIENSDEKQGLSEEVVPEKTKALLESEKLVEEFKHANEGSRCIVRIFHFIQEMLKMCGREAHGPFGCTGDNVKFTGIRNYGLKTKFLFICDMCNEHFTIDSEPNDQYMNLNQSAVAGVKSAGSDYIELEEFCGFTGIRCMSEKTYQKISVQLDIYYTDIAEIEMLVAGGEEKRIANELNSKENDCFTCPIVVDGSWSKRSYGSQGRSKTGAAVGIGNRTGKVLFYGWKNKYCSICKLAEKKKKLPREHLCYKNWPEDQSASSMEAAIIVEGFERSIQDHSLMYTEIIADGDSSVYSRVLQSCPYKGIYIKKIECINHLLRNTIKDIKKVKSVKTGSAGTKCKKEIITNIMRIRYAVVKAAEYRMTEKEVTFEEKIENLRSDIQNIIPHIFGEHNNCATYFCKKEEKKDEINFVPELQQLGLFDFLQNILVRLSYNAESILHRKSSNRVEAFNSIINKKIGGKRKSISQRGLYPGKLAIAVIQFNTQRPVSRLNEYLNKIPPDTGVEMEDRRIRKNKYNVAKIKETKMARKFEKDYSDDEKAEKLKENQSTSKIGKEDYGKNCHKPDISREEFLRRVNDHYESLYVKLQTREVLEKCTRGNKDNHHKIFITQKNVLMEHHFGEICRKRPNTKNGTLIKKILYPSIRRGDINKYEETQKIAVKKYLEENCTFSIEECGLFIYEELPYLCSLPDGLLTNVQKNDTILLIECPFVARDVTPGDAILHKIGQIHKMFNKEVNKLNENSLVYYKIIGAMEIAQKPFGLFVLKTSQGIVTINVDRNEHFWQKNMKDYLMNFYEQKLMPEIIDSRQNRSMDIRESIDLKIVSFSTYVRQNILKIKEDSKNKIEDKDCNDDEENSRKIKEQKILSGMEQSVDINKFRSQKQDYSNCKRKSTSAQKFAKIMIHNYWISSDEIDDFANIVISSSQGYYIPESTVRSQLPQFIKPICPLKKHIQILHNCKKHWICCYFDTEQIYAYDSLNWNTLQEEEITILECLFPHYQFREKSIHFVKVREQDNSHDCGLFAIAFAITLMHGLHPEEIEYDRNKMREHLCKILENKTIEHFPIDKEKCQDIVIPSLQEVIDREISENQLIHKFIPVGLKCLCTKDISTKKRSKKSIDEANFEEC